MYVDCQFKVDKSNQQEDYFDYNNSIHKHFVNLNFVFLFESYIYYTFF
jgi:hypothetical protein